MARLAAAASLAQGSLSATSISDQAMGLLVEQGPKDLGLIWEASHLEGPQAGQHPEEARLAAAVWAHDHDAAAGRHLKGQLPHQLGPVRGVERHPVRTESGH